ncbi:MAG: hypothetical protein A2113_04065 [Candidatus Woykebacteria bacterium GWA1_44_8]|uniref:Uncharacterized protein n=1 Tax=Candidatus Woykebacteria bacterium GWA1_44_8 TaxID=1802591 RepID=A0A1G1W247_9BACT|nr:MAG: hypothetical protein A2113_04065 [Candidatus Woykebacteria bacterium GWA1_44_8]
MIGASYGASLFVALLQKRNPVLQTSFRHGVWVTPVPNVNNNFSLVKTLISHWWLVIGSRLSKLKMVE